MRICVVNEFGDEQKVIYNMESITNENDGATSSMDKNHVLNVIHWIDSVRGCNGGCPTCLCHTQLNVS